MAYLYAATFGTGRKTVTLNTFVYHQDNITRYDFLRMSCQPLSKIFYHLIRLQSQVCNSQIECLWIQKPKHAKPGLHIDWLMWIPLISSKVYHLRANPRLILMKTYQRLPYSASDHVVYSQTTMLRTPRKVHKNVLKQNL